MGEAVSETVSDDARKATVPTACNKVVFLDFDGVLNSSATYVRVAKTYTLWPWTPALGLALLDAERVARVQRICDAAGAAVVIVSSWRRYAPPEALADVLAQAGLRAPVLGAIRGLRMFGETRALATFEWLEGHPEVTHWVVVDDDRDHWRNWLRERCCEERLVCPKDGITDANADAAIGVLSIAALSTSPSATPGPVAAPVTPCAEVGGAGAPQRLTDREAIHRLAVALGYAKSESDVDVDLRAYRGPGERSDRKGHRSAVLACHDKSFYDPEWLSCPRRFLSGDGATDAAAVEDLRGTLARRVHSAIEARLSRAAEEDRCAAMAQKLAAEHREAAARLTAILDAAEGVKP